MARLGYHVLSWDIRWGSRYDLMARANQQLIRGWLLSRVVVAFHVGTPCKSWSRARDRPGGPPRLRSNEELWGLPNLRPADALAIKQGNALAKFSASLLLVALHMRIPAGMENPASSRIWLIPPLKRLAVTRRCSQVVTDFCQWGTDWLKPTRLLGVFLEFRALDRRCKFRVLGHCSCSGKAHRVLSGTAPGGRFWTAIAEAYPTRFCTSLAKVVDHAVHAVRGQVLSEHMKRRP